MPIVGLGLHFAIALFFAVHAVRTGRETYWLAILFSFPLLGSIVYFFAVYLPQSRVERGIQQAASSAIRLLDPERELRAAEDAYDLSPSAQNQWRLAEALMARGEGRQALTHFDALLAGPLGGDPELMLAAARARLDAGEGAGAVALARRLRDERPEVRPEERSLLLARALAAIGEHDQAGREFAAAVDQFGSVDARAAYALFCATRGELAIARQLRAELARDSRHWNRHARAAHAPALQAIDQALAREPGQA
jgi:hypothetical protein